MQSYSCFRQHYSRGHFNIIIINSCKSQIIIQELIYFNKWVYTSIACQIGARMAQCAQTRKNIITIIKSYKSQIIIQAGIYFRMCSNSINILIITKSCMSNRNKNSTMCTNTNNILVVVNPCNSKLFRDL